VSQADRCGKRYSKNGSLNDCGRSSHGGRRGPKIDHTGGKVSLVEEEKEVINKGDKRRGKSAGRCSKMIAGNRHSLEQTACRDEVC